MKDSVLGNASFEKTPDHLFNAAVSFPFAAPPAIRPSVCTLRHAQTHSRVDDVNGVSACIIMGSPMELGTGCFKLLRQVAAPELPPKRKALFP